MRISKVQRDRQGEKMNTQETTANEKFREEGSLMQTGESKQGTVKKQYEDVWQD